MSLHLGCFHLLQQYQNQIGLVLFSSLLTNGLSFSLRATPNSLFSSLISYFFKMVGVIVVIIIVANLNVFSARKMLFALVIFLVSISLIVLTSLVESVKKGERASLDWNWKTKAEFTRKQMPKWSTRLSLLKGQILRTNG